MLARTKCTEHPDCQVEKGPGGGVVHFRQSKKVSQVEWDQMVASVAADRYALQQATEKLRQATDQANAIAAVLQVERKGLQQVLRADGGWATRAEYNRLQEELAGVNATLGQFATSLYEQAEALTVEREELSRSRARLEAEESRVRAAVEAQADKLNKAVSDKGIATKHDVNALSARIDKLESGIMDQLQDAVKTLREHKGLSRLVKSALKRNADVIEKQAAEDRRHALGYDELIKEWHRYHTIVDDKLDRIRKQLKEQHDNFWDHPEEAWRAFKELERGLAKVSQDQIDTARRFERRVNELAGKQEA